MSVVQITSLTGHSPYDITICDKTKTYCETVDTPYDGNSNFLITSVLNDSKVDSIFFKNMDGNHNLIFSLTNYVLN